MLVGAQCGTYVLRIKLLEPRSFRWRLDLWNVCAFKTPLVLRVKEAKLKGVCLTTSARVLISKWEKASRVRRKLHYLQSEVHGVPIVFTKHYEEQQIKEAEGSGDCCTHGQDQNAYATLFGYLKGRCLLEDLDVKGRIISK
jgi:hypothetical protein